MRRRSSVLAIAVVAIVCGVPLAACAQTYSGSLSSASGQIDGRQEWIDPGPTMLSWEVTDMGAFYHYQYTLAVPQNSSEISHFIIGVSDNFGIGDFWNETGAFQGTEVGDFDQANGNPSIPGLLHGLKFDDTSGTTLVVDFDSSRVPVWGDFYAKCGGNPPNEAWNLGFALPNPTDPPSNGTISNHILVPDTVVPEPSSLLLCLLALPGACLLAWRRWRK